MKTDRALCVGCNKCIFKCPTRANTAILENSENKILIDSTLCISCGECADICDHRARALEDDTARFFADLAQGKPVSVIAAPSIKHNINDHEKLFGYLKSLGVNLIYDVSFGADISTWRYLAAAKKSEPVSMIAQPCPVVVLYIENFKPELIPNLSPVHSPALCTAIYLKKYEKIRDNIAFLSPCIAKTDEFADPNTGGFVNYNVTYKNLLNYIEEHGVDLSAFQNKGFDSRTGNMGFTFSRPGGLMENIRFYLSPDIWIHQIEGIHTIKSYLNEYAVRFRQNKPVPFLIDALNCQNGCNSGTGTFKNTSVDEVNFKTNNLKKSVDKQNAQKLMDFFDTSLNPDDFIRTYTDKSCVIAQASEQEIERVFTELEKHSENERHINCFSCGFGNCRDFANAVALGQNHKENCSRYSHKRLRSQTQALEEKNRELAASIERTRVMEESLEVEREINEFAVITKYDLVSLLSVPRRQLTVYKNGQEFVQGGLETKSDYDTSTKLVLNNLVHADDRENFKRLFFDHLIAELNANGKVVHEYRLLDIHSGIYRWKRVLYRYFENSKNSVIQLTEDINHDMVIKTQLESKNEELSLNETCFKVLAEQTNKVIFEWNFSSGKISSMSNFKALFGREAVTSSSAHEAILANVIHPDDKKIFSELFKIVVRKKSINDIRFRIADNKGLFHWCSLSGIVVEDKNGKPYKAIGTLENIEEQLNKEALLRKKAEQDQLTGLYNKTTTEILIKKILNDRKYTGDSHALMIVDVDNFKSVNDQLGHLYGDVVLFSLSEKLKSVFRAGDVIGRIGGDEFFVFLKDVNDIGMIKAKATAVCNLFRNTYTSEGLSVSISASVGIAVSPEHGSDFDVLYKNADTALYNAKAAGKNNFTLYDGKTVLRYQSARTKIDTRGSIQKSFRENRVEYIFRLLYTTKNNGENIESVLQLMAEHFGFSKVIMYELSKDQALVNCPFEWQTAGVSSTAEETKSLTKSDLHLIKDCFGTTNSVLLKSVKELPDSLRIFFETRSAKLVLFFPLYSDGVFSGCLVFQDCKNTVSTLHQNDISDMDTMCSILTTFLTNQRLLKN